MAAGVMQEYVDMVSYAVSSENGAALANALSLQSEDPSLAPAAVALATRGRSPFRKLPGQYSGMVLDHYKAAAAVQSLQWQDAFKLQLGLLKEFTMVVEEAEDNWQLEALHVVCKQAYILALLAEADSKQGGEGSSGKSLKSLAAQLRIAFATLNKHRTEPGEIDSSKKWGALYVANLSTKCWFKLNQARNSSFTALAIEGPRFPPMHDFPVGQQVTYKYYAGRLKLLEGDMAAANEALSSAYRACKASATHNRRLILKYLVPVRMHLGYLPSPSLLAANKLPEYGALADSIREGDVRAFRGACAAHQLDFIASGVFLLVEGLVLHVYRRLFKRTALVVGSPLVPLPAFQAALAMCGEEVSTQELHCIVATLVARKMAKGNIVLKHDKLVMHKADPFPSTLRK